MIVERPALERRVTASLDAGRIPVVLGGCGTGRTSLLLRLESLLGRERSQYIDISAVASTPERCLRAIAGTSRFRPAVPAGPLSTRESFDAMLACLDAPASSGGSATYLLDEFLDVRTFESFPGLRHVQRELIEKLAASASRLVLASRFTARAHRLLRDAPARFEVIHIPPLDLDDIQTMAMLFGNGHRDPSAIVIPSVRALVAGRATPVCMLLEWLTSNGPATDPVAGLAALFSPDGQLAARYRECFEFRLQRARGYGALKAILGVLAESEPLNLTEISHQLQRTPGSTKDYLSWLEDVDLITAQGKRYSYEDPLLRLYVRLYTHAAPPNDADVVREVGAYARARLPILAEPVAVGAHIPAAPIVEGRSGIIEID